MVVQRAAFLSRQECQPCTIQVTHYGSRLTPHASRITPDRKPSRMAVALNWAGPGHSHHMQEITMSLPFGRPSLGCWLAASALIAALTLAPAGPGKLALQGERVSAAPVYDDDTDAARAGI